MILKIKKYAVFLGLITILILLFVVNKKFTFAQESPTSTPTASPTSSPVHVEGCPHEDLTKCIQFFQEKVNQLNDQGKTLSSQIAVMSNQINLTEARIQATKQEISDLILDIDTTTKKISNLQESLNALTEVLLNRIVVTYEVGTAQPFEIFLSSNDVSNFFSRLNYLKIAQIHDKKLIYDTQAAKNDYVNQKEIFENKKKKVETLKSQLEAYTDQLAQEKKDRETLLEVTQNSEAIYQQRLQAALAEQQAIELITKGGGNAVDVGPVKEGNIIGHMINGESACSYGTHLHFEVHKNNSLQDPTSYLSNKSVSYPPKYPDPQLSFTGSWSWPLEDPIEVEQGYGMTYYARVLGYYKGGPHTGIDIFSYSAVRAVKDGELFRGSIACAGGQLLFARVDQENGIQTFYLHIVP